MRAAPRRRLAPVLAALLACSPARAQQPEPGFRPLFDGTSLAGWVTRGGRYDGDALWSVEDGALVGRPTEDGRGGLLYTEGLFTSFVLRLEVTLDQPFDSGIFVRMAPHGRGAQLTLDHRPGGEIGAVYSDGFLAHCERGAQLFRNDAWNEVEVVCTGFDMHLTCTLNGTRLTDYQVDLAREPAGAEPYAPTGRIGLQVHGGGADHGAVRFRNVRVRELPVLGAGLFEPVDAGRPGLLRLSDAARAAGWRALFDGTSLAGWTATVDQEACVARDGVLAFLARGKGGELRSIEDFRDFRLRLDFEIAPMANSGVFLRAARDGSNPAFSGCEVQILDDFDWESVTKTTLKPWQFSGSLYGSVPAGDRSLLRRPGEWNTYEILYRGTRLAVALNGRTLYDVDTLALVPESGPPFAQRAPSGFLGLQHHGSENVTGEFTVQFRNLFMQPLAP